MSIWATIPGLLARHRALYDEGASHSAIGRVLTAEFGVTVSRNASIGKTHRMKYPARAVKHGVTHRGRVGPRKPKPKPVAVREPESVPENISLLELTGVTCKWPVSGQGADMRFCGARSQNGSSYCGHHKARSVSKATPKAKKSFTAYSAWLSQRVIAAGG